MDVSVIIVNYNVEHFLAQCLQSVRQGMEVLKRLGYSGETFVVDNHSVDGSCAMVRAQFPEVELLALEENLGFSKANNLAILQAQGRWVLLLNPDTVIQEDTLIKCLEYADNQPKLGGMGVPMVDGNGVYLPESKRGIPTPSAAFWKISGLYRLAPRSAKINRYYQGHLSQDETHCIEILSGAFMWMRKESLDAVGVLDETYFMYGEDIDLSWRLIKGGWENHYFAETSIIHYKGESTKKGSLNYVLVFYRAMQIFAKTHFSGPGGQVMHAVIQWAIYVRAALAIGSRIWKAISLPLIECALMWGGLVGLLQAYGAWKSIVYDWSWALPAMAVYALVWTGVIKLQGGYDPPWRWNSILKGVALGSLVLFASYGLLPEDVRFSRAILVLGTAMVPLILVCTRFVAGKLTGSSGGGQVKRLYVSGPEDLDRIKDLIRSMDVLEPVEFGVVHAICPYPQVASQTASDVQWLGGMAELDEAIRVHGFNQIIMSGRDVTASMMIQAMTRVTQSAVRFRIAWTDDGQIVGAGGPERGAITDLNGAIFKPRARRSKRVFDVVASLLVLVIFPVFLVRRQSRWLGAALSVMAGQTTWVGFTNIGPSQVPYTHRFVFQRVEDVSDRVGQRTLLTYVRDYRWTMDLQVIWEALISYRAIHRHGHY